VKLAEFLEKHGLERQVRLLIRGGVLTLNELEAIPDERLGALNLPPRELLTLRKALGRKIEEPEPLPVVVPKEAKPAEKPATRVQEKSEPKPGRARNLKTIFLVVFALVLIGCITLAVLLMNRDMLYESEKISPHLPWGEKQKTTTPVATTEGTPNLLQKKEESSVASLEVFTSRYQSALKKQDPAEIASFFIPEGLIDYYQKALSRQELLKLLESEKLNDPILIRAVAYLGTVDPSADSAPEITRVRFSLQYDTKKGKYEKKIRVGLQKNATSGFAIFSETNESAPVLLEATPVPPAENPTREPPFSPAAWTDPGPLAPGQIHQLQLVFYGLRPTREWCLPDVPKMQVLGQPSMSQTFHAGRTDMNLLFSIRLTDPGEVKIPAFQVMTERGMVEVPGIVLNPVSQGGGGGSTVERTVGRGLPPRRKTKDQQNDVAEMKDFYSPADVFPDGKIGLRLVGKFIVLQFSNGGSYLSADESRGEKDTMRSFIPENCDLPLGARFTFTREQPLVISSGGLLGQYHVLVPNGIRPDRY
jgi:hypothetical protein